MRALLVLTLAGCLARFRCGVRRDGIDSIPIAGLVHRLQGKASTSASREPIPAGAARIRRPKRVRDERAPLRPSEGQLAGLTHSGDPLQLKSHVALVVDQDTNEVLFEKNIHAVLPIASITKLMTALVTVEAGLPLDEELKVTPDELVRAGIRSKLASRPDHVPRTALHLALMSSENRAAQLLGRTYPGGLDNFVEAMNAKARMLGMSDSHFVDPTGLSPDNRSSANDLVRLVKAAYEHDVIREYSVSEELALPVGKRSVRYANTNSLTAKPRLGNRPAEDRLYLRGGPLPRDAGGDRGQAGGDGAARFGRQVFAHRRCAADPRLARVERCPGEGSCAFSRLLRWQLRQTDLVPCARGSGWPL